MSRKNKDEIIARGLKELLDKKKMEVESITTRFPKGFLEELSEILPPDLPFSTTSGSLSGYFFRKNGSHKQDILEILNQPYEDNVDNVNITEPAPLSDEHSLSASQLTPDDVKKICNELINERLTDIEHNVHNTHIKLVPKAKIIKGKGKGRKAEREYYRLSITVDEELMKLFNKEAKKLNITAPRLLDSILWERYGYPKLSFQPDEETS